MVIADTNTARALTDLLDRPSPFRRTPIFGVRDTYQAPPADPVALHKYLYAGADPINKTDPSGLFFGLGDTLSTAAAYGTMYAMEAAPVLSSFLYYATMVTFGASLAAKGLEAVLYAADMDAAAGYMGTIGDYAAYGAGFFSLAYSMVSPYQMAGYSNVNRTRCAGYGLKDANYIAKRGWSMNQINDLITNPATPTGTTVNVATGNSATAYFVGPNQYVIIDDVTHELVQISNLNKPDWIVDDRIAR